MSDGILASSATVQMSAATPNNSVAGFIIGEQIVLLTTPAGTNYVWAESLPNDSASALSGLSGSTGATVTFIPDVGGMYVIACTVDAVAYSLVISVTDTSVSTPVAALRIQAQHDAAVPTPTAGAIAVFVSIESGVLSTKDHTGTVTAIGSNSGSLPTPTTPGDGLFVNGAIQWAEGPVPTALTVNSFTTSRGLFRAGATSANPATFAASYNHTPTTVTITDDQGGPVSAFGASPFTSGTYPHSYTKNGVANVNYPLVATDSVGSVANGTVADRWGFDVYHGAAASVTTSADIKALATDVLAQSRVVANFAAASTGTDYDFFCIPSSFGTPTFTDVTTNTPVPFTQTATVSVTNANGITVNYDVWRSFNQGIGTAGTIVMRVS